MSLAAPSRRIWVAIINGLLAAYWIRYMVHGVAADLQDQVRAYRAQLPDIRHILSVTLLVLGIVLELTRSKAARFVNIGYFGLASLWAIAVFVAELLGFVHADGISIVYLLFYGPPALAITMIYWRLYRRDGTDAPQPQQSESPV